MFLFLKYLIQLILSPENGWQDLENSKPDATKLARTGLYPLLGILAATELLSFFYEKDITIGEVLIRAITDFGTFFASLFIAKLIIELYIGRLTASRPDSNRIDTLAVIGIGLMTLTQIINNCLPWSLVVLTILPIYVILVLFKAIPYIGINKDNELKFTGLCAGAIVAVPLIIYYLLHLIIS
ncbi:MAG: hypothetical protein J1F05_01250 [Muribaculaceae bacterium]|nr:hypothetical protein [Muribaculaceae bacterium]